MQGVLIVSGGEDHNRKKRVRDSPQQLKSIHVRHLHVQKEQVRPGSLNLVHRLEAIGTFTNDIDVEFLSQEQANALPGQRFVIHDKRPDFHVVWLGGNARCTGAKRNGR